MCHPLANLLEGDEAIEIIEREPPGLGGKSVIRAKFEEGFSGF